jgi:uncharacterized protein (DUF4415 family)
MYRLCLKMKRKIRVTKGGKIARLKASAHEGRRQSDWFGGISKFYKPIKKRVTLRLDADVLAWFKKQGRGYQTRINRVLRRMMMEQRKKSGE